MRQPGLLVAPLTPFTADLKVDERSLRRQIDYVVRDCACPPWWSRPASRPRNIPI